MAQLVRQFASGIYNLILGLFTTSKHLGRHAITIQYPKERWTIPERSRGMVVLLTDHETGKLNCTACLLCARACPTGAITIEYEKDEKKKRHLKEFKVNYNICCLCGLCEDACNFAAIKMATYYEYPEYDKSRLVYDTEQLAKMGYDVPYEKPVRKKPVAKKPAPKKPDDKTTESKPAEDKAAGEKPKEEQAVKPEAESKPVESEPEDKKSAEEPPEKKDDSDQSGPDDSDAKEDKSS